MGSNRRNSDYWGSGSSSSVPPSGAPGGSQQPGWDQNGYRQSYPYNQRKPYSSGKSHVAAGLLAIFLGGLGIHKFYLGYNSAGFVMLGVTILGSIFTFGLAGSVMEVIGIVEGVIYLSKDQQSFDRMYVYNMKEWF